MQIEELGEAGLIQAISETIHRGNDARNRHFRPGFCLRLSIGDDAAAWNSSDATTIITSDVMVEGVHFDLSKIGWRDLGWKAIAINLSDIAAMGCAPLCSVVTLGLRGDLPVNGIIDMYNGMVEASSESGSTIVGGDTVRSPVFFVSVTMTGEAYRLSRKTKDGGQLLTRRSAKNGDKIAVTGHLGCSSGGLLALNSKVELDKDTYNHLVTAHHRPDPRVDEGTLLALNGVQTAIDVSDGLLQDLSKLCKASDVGARIHADAVPVDKFLRRSYPEDWLSLALSGGEDYELLFTATPDTIETVSTMSEVPISIIGDIVKDSKEIRVLDKTGTPMTVNGKSWEHFRQSG